MAKVTGGLFSMSASGQFGKSLVFQKNGRVREYVVPANPNTLLQQAVRNTLKDIQAQLVILGTDLRTELKAQFGPQWNSMIISELMKDANANLLVYTAEFALFGAPDQGDWETADTSFKALLDDGVALYAVASAVYDMGVRLGATLSLTLPAAANSTTVKGEWIASTP
jgi:hypothetical protein